MKPLLRHLLMVLAALAPAVLQAAGSMDGTYTADCCSVLVPVQGHLAVEGSKATMILRGPDGEQTREFGVWEEGGMLVLTVPGGKRGDGGLVFYRRIGDSVMLECVMCGKVGIPVVWLSVARSR